MQLFVNDLTVMDFSYLCPVRGIVGESWIVDVILRGDLNEESMVQDFGIVKKSLKNLVDEYVDHKLLVPVEHKNTDILRNESSDQVEVNFALDNKQSIQLFCPADAYAFIYDSVISMDSVSRYLKDVIAMHLPENVDGIELKLRTEVIETPYYHYTHGLKKHDGNCQRIAHGHRSKIDIYIDGQLNIEMEQYWANRWADIYIGSVEDEISTSNLLLSKKLSDYEHYLCFAYESTQGYFEIVVPKSKCEIIDTDSTVECLAQFILEQTRQYTDSKDITVLAYEGVGKGALVNNLN